MPSKSDRRLLAEQYPAAFAPKGQGFRKKPLKMGIEFDLLHRGLRDAQGFFMTLDRIEKAVKEYTNGAKYAHALARGGSRYDLDGLPHGRVSEITQSKAIARIARNGWQNHDGVKIAA